MEEGVKKNNIYYLSSLKDLAALEDEVGAVSLSVGLNINRTIQEAGITSPSDMLDKAIEYWDERLHAEELPPEDELIRELQDDFQLKIMKTGKSFMPPDELDSSRNTSTESSERLEVDANRISLALRTILHMKLQGESLHLDDIDVLVSKVPKNSWRSRPYWAINLKKHDIVVLVNNQYANQTFVLHYKSKADLRRVLSLTKQELKSLDAQHYFTHYFPFHDEASFETQLAEVLREVAQGAEQLKPYKTYEEAQEAARKLGITSMPDYRKNYTRDSRLHSAPDRFYRESWTGWHNFLGKEKIDFYPSLQEAKDALKALGITSFKEYRTRHHEDPRLPGAPDVTYADEFIDWGDYLRDDPKNLYETYEEAQKAALALGATSAPDYRKKRKQDPRLPFNPAQKYADEWTSWHDFLKKTVN